MGWFSKKQKVEKVEQAAKTSPKESLQEEVERLRAQSADALVQQAELQQAIEAAEHQRDVLRAEMEETLTNERQQHADVIAEMNRKHGEFLSFHSESQHKIQLLDEANAAMAKMLQERDLKIEGLSKALEGETHANESMVAERDSNIESLKKTIEALESKLREIEPTIAERETKIEGLQKALDNELHAHEALVTGRDQKLKELEAQVATLTQEISKSNEIASTKVWELEQRLTVETNKAAARISEIEAEAKAKEASTAERILDAEKRLAADTAVAAARIAQLEQQLAESEAKSQNRAQQRSALLRNMAEIHRLSTISAKPDVTPEALKLMGAEWSGQAEKPSESNSTESSTPNPFFSRTPGWKEKSDIESA